MKLLLIPPFEVGSVTYTGFVDSSRKMVRNAFSLSRPLIRGSSGQDLGHSRRAEAQQYKRPSAHTSEIRQQRMISLLPNTHLVCMYSHSVHIISRLVRAYDNYIISSTPQ